MRSRIPILYIHPVTGCSPSWLLNSLRGALLELMFGTRVVGLGRSRRRAYG
jgi:hypothetical protein